MRERQQWRFLWLNTRHWWMLISTVNDNLQQQAQSLMLDYLQTQSLPEVLLTNIATIKYGKGLPKSELTSHGFPVYGGNGVIGCYDKYLYELPQILISCRGAASGNIIITVPKSYVTSNSLVAELKDYRYFEFLKQYMLLNPLFAYATGSAQPQITIANLSNVTVPYPKYDDIASLSSQLKTYSETILARTIENDALVNVRDALLPQLLSGSLEISALQGLS